jgi:hypothetical protein
MICWNYGRPDEKEVTVIVLKGMIGVVIHEVGHKLFPMIVNSDVNGLGWMKD